MWIIIWKNVFDSWSPWPGPRGCFGALSGKEGGGRDSEILCDGAWESRAIMSNRTMHPVWPEWPDCCQSLLDN